MTDAQFKENTERGTCDECGRNNIETSICVDARYGDEIDVCSFCIEFEPELNPTQTDGDDRYNDTDKNQEAGGDD
jgi:hypothetical protein